AKTTEASTGEPHEQSTAESEQSVEAPTEAAITEPPPEQAPPTTKEVTGELRKSAEERKAILDQRLANAGAQGWRIENRSDYQATIAKGKPVHHLLHLFLTVITAGPLAIRWILLPITGRVESQLLTPYQDTN